MVEFSFKLPESFLDGYKNRAVNWGFTDAGGNSLGELTFIRTYSRVKEDGTKEKWWEVCQRVIQGMYSIQKDHAKHNNLPWNDRKAQASAQEAFELMFEFKWTPPGRGLWVMGTELVMNSRNSAALQNCAFVSTADMDKGNPGELFSWVMDALMLGVGVGADTKGAAKEIYVNTPLDDKDIYVVPDTREGWTESLRLKLNSYLKPHQNSLSIDTSLVRDKGEPIKGFGGTASGPEPLIHLHDMIDRIFSAESGKLFGSRLITDVINLIGACVVAGNVRRSAEIMLGSPDDKDFINLKNAEVFPERNSYDPENPGWGWMSNNSLSVPVNQDYSKFVERIISNGEPGFVWLT